MCRLLAVVSSEKTDFRFSLADAPRSLAALSVEHPDGWGIAVLENGAPVALEKRPVKAHGCEKFGEISAAAQGDVLVAHVRKRTVGPIGYKNTHPFRRAGWIFAHNGTIEQTSWLRERISAARLAEIEGDTDSELLFAMLLTLLDEHGAGHASSGANLGGVDTSLLEVMAAFRAHGNLGAANFLLTDGNVLYAHRFGRTLFVLDRTRVEESHSSETGASISMHPTAERPRRRAIVIASERITDEPWEELPEGTLIRAERAPRPHYRVVSR